MKLSLFTPTHNPKYLSELYESIKDQEFHEWVIVPNNGAVVPDFKDKRVKVFPLKFAPEYVGALKRYACDKCEGDILVEVDHDDVLMPDALAEVTKAFEDQEVGFVYSNTANFKDNFQPTEKYDASYGWQYRKVTYKGYELDECISFPPTPEAVSKIWFAPNHIRAWRKEAYYKAGGHAEDMRVLDDQDLIARTYLVTRFKHIDKCLYLYRITGENTWLRFNQEIQSNVHRLYDKYIYDLVLVWAEREGLRKLDLGGRFNSNQGFETVDLKNADVICDLNQKWPFADSSVGVIVANDFLEHLKDPLFTMKEIYRVLAPGGWLLAKTPSTDGRGAFQDPTHISFWNENSFLYYTVKEFAKYIDTPVNFQSARLYTTEKNPIQVCWVISHLVALKGNRPPGQILI